MRLRPFLAIAILCFAQEKKGPEFLRPLDESILSSGNVRVVARIPEGTKLLVDGKPADPALKLSPGRHELALSSGQKIQVFVQGGSESAPAGWQAFREHPPGTAACATCHNDKGATTAQICMGCHQAAKFPVAHTHAVDVLDECQLCHQPHGSKTRFHLKFTKETACKQCHG